MVTEAESHQWILADRMENLGDPADGLQEGLLLDGEEADHVNNIVYHHGEEGEGEGGAEPPEVVVEQGAHRRRRANIAEWANEELDVDMRPFTAVAGPRLPPDHAFADPLSVFDLFWEDLPAEGFICEEHESVCPQTTLKPQRTCVPSSMEGSLQCRDGCFYGPDHLDGNKGAAK